MHNPFKAATKKKPGHDPVLLMLLIIGGSALTDVTFAHAATSENPPDSVIWHDVDLSAHGEIPLQLLAQNLGEKTPSVTSVGYHRDGVGASGTQARAPAIRAETGLDPVSGDSEHMYIQFQENITRAEFLLTYFYPREVEIGGVSYNEQGNWRAYMGNKPVAEGQFTSNANDGNYRLTVATQKPFDRIEFSAMPYVSDNGVEIVPGSVLTDSSDFLIKHVAYQTSPENSPLSPRSHRLETGRAPEEPIIHTQGHKLAAD